jgi:hypothetical protein
MQGNFLYYGDNLGIRRRYIKDESIRSQDDRLKQAEA